MKRWAELIHLNALWKSFLTQAGNGYAIKWRTSQSSALTFFVQSQNNLVTAIKNMVRLDFVEKDGATLRQKIEALEVRGIQIAELNGETLPPLHQKLTHYENWILGHFQRVSRSRTQAEVGPHPISYVELKSYVDMGNDCLDAFECETIMAMDCAYVEACLVLHDKNRPD